MAKSQLPGMIPQALLDQYRARGKTTQASIVQRARSRAFVPRQIKGVHEAAKQYDQAREAKRLAALAPKEHSGGGGFGGFLHDIPVVGAVSKWVDDNVADPILHGASIAAHTPAAMMYEAGMIGKRIGDVAGFSHFQAERDAALAQAKAQYASIQQSRDGYQTRHDAGDPAITDQFMQNMNVNVKKTLDHLHRVQKDQLEEGAIGFDAGRYAHNVIEDPVGWGTYLQRSGAMDTKNPFMKALVMADAVGVDLSTDITLKLKGAKLLEGGREAVMGHVLAEAANASERVLEAAGKGDRLALKLMKAADAAGGGKAAFDQVVKNHAMLVATKAGAKGGASLTRSEAKLFLGTTGGMKLAGHTIVPMEATHLVTKPLTRSAQGLRSAGTLGKVADEFSGKYGSTLRRGMRSGDVGRAVPDFQAQRTFDLVQNMASKRVGSWEADLAKVGKKVSTKDHAGIIHAVESLDPNQIAALPERSRVLVEHVQQALEEAHKVATDAGIDVAHQAGYIPQYVSDAAKKILDKARIDATTLGGARSGGARSVGFDLSRAQPGEKFMGKILPAFETPAEGRAAKQAIFDEVTGTSGVDLFETNLNKVLPRYYRDAADATAQAELKQALGGMNLLVDAKTGASRAVPDLTARVDEIGKELHPDEPPPGGGGAPHGPEEPPPPRGGYRPRDETGKYMTPVDEARNGAVRAEDALNAMADGPVEEQLAAEANASRARAEAVLAEAGVDPNVVHPWHASAKLTAENSRAEIRQAVVDDFAQAHDGRLPRGDVEKKWITAKVTRLQRGLARDAEARSLNAEVDAAEQKLQEATAEGNGAKVQHAERDAKRISRKVKAYHAKYADMGESPMVATPRNPRTPPDDVIFDPQGTRDYEISNDPNSTPKEKVAARKRLQDQLDKSKQKSTQSRYGAVNRDNAAGKANLTDSNGRALVSRPGTDIDPVTGRPMPLTRQLSQDASDIAGKGRYRGPAAEQGERLEATLGEEADNHFARAIADLSPEDQRALWVQKFQAEFDALFPAEGSGVESSVTRSGATMYHDRGSVVINWADKEGVGQELDGPLKGFEQDAKASQDAAATALERDRALSGDARRVVSGKKFGLQPSDRAKEAGFTGSDYPIAGEGISPEERAHILREGKTAPDGTFSIGGMPAEGYSASDQALEQYAGAANDGKASLTDAAEADVHNLAKRMQQRLGGSFRVTATEARLTDPSNPNKVLHGYTLLVEGRPWNEIRQAAPHVTAEAEATRAAFEARSAAAGGLVNEPYVSPTEKAAQILLDATEGDWVPTRLGRAPTDEELSAEIRQLAEIVPGSDRLPPSLVRSIMEQAPEKGATAAEDVAKTATPEDAAASFKQTLGGGEKPTVDPRAGERPDWADPNKPWSETSGWQPKPGTGEGLADPELLKLHNTIKEMPARSSGPEGDFTGGFKGADKRGVANAQEDYLDKLIHLAQRVGDPHAEAAAEAVVHGWIGGKDVSQDADRVLQMLHLTIDPAPDGKVFHEAADTYQDIIERLGDKTLPRFEIPATSKDDPELAKLIADEEKIGENVKAGRAPTDDGTKIVQDVQDALHSDVGAAPPSNLQGIIDAGNPRKVLASMRNDMSAEDVLRQVERTRPDLQQHLDPWNQFAEANPELRDPLAREQIIEDVHGPDDLARAALEGDTAAASLEHAMNVKYGTKWRDQFPQVAAYVSDKPAISYVNPPAGVMDATPIAGEKVAPHLDTLNASDAGDIIGGREDFGWLHDQVVKHAEAGHEDASMAYRVAAAEEDPAKRLVATMEANALAADAAEEDGAKVLNGIEKGVAAGPHRAAVVDELQAAIGRSMKKLLSDPSSMAPADVADAIDILSKGYTKTGIETFLDKHLAPLVNWMKVWQTTSPGFHIRNAIGNVFNNWLADVSPEAYTKFFRLQRAINEGPNGARWAALSVEEKQWATTLAGLDLHGPFSTQFLTNDTLKGKFAEHNPFGKRGPIARGSTKVGGMADALGRGPLAVDTLMKGGSAEDAVAAINKFHFNYADLSRAEQNLKRFVPFYTFTRHNLPLQIQYALTNSKILGSYLVVKHNAELFAPKNPIHQPWLTEGIAGGFATPLQFGGGDMFASNRTPMGEASDIIHDPKSMLLGQITPLVKIPIEQYTGKRFFKSFETSDAQIPMPSIFHALPFVPDALVAVGVAQKSKKGYTMRSDVVQDLGDVVPILGRAFRLAPGDDPARQRSVVNSWISFALGGALKTNTREQQLNEWRGRKSSAAYSEIDAIKKKMASVPFRKLPAHTSYADEPAWAKTVIQQLRRKKELEGYIDDIQSGKIKAPIR